MSDTPTAGPDSYYSRNDGHTDFTRREKERLEYKLRQCAVSAAGFRDKGIRQSERVLDAEGAAAIMRRGIRALARAVGDDPRLSGVRTDLERILADERGYRDGDPFRFEHEVPAVRA